MSRYIDAVGLKIKLGKRLSTDERRIMEIVKETIDSMPTIDIVLCKDCMFSKVYQADSRGNMARVCKAYKHSRLASDDDFCSDGERIEK